MQREAPTPIGDHHMGYLDFAEDRFRRTGPIRIFVAAVFLAALACTPAEAGIKIAPQEPSATNIEPTSPAPEAPADAGSRDESSKTVIPNTDDPASSTDLATKSAKRLALLIGNSAYETVPRLNNPSNDAQALGSVLVDLGFEVMLALNEDRNQLHETFRRFSERLNESEVGLFFYAGHAVEIKGENYIIPTGTRSIENEQDIEIEGFSISRALRIMETSVPVRLIILDACRDNPFAGATRSTSQSSDDGAQPGRSVPRGLVPGPEGGIAQISGGLGEMNPGSPGTFIAFATAPGKVSYDGVGANSPYTQAIVEHIATPGLTVEAAFRKVAAQVYRETEGRQVPWTHSSLLSEFYFAGPLEPTLPLVSSAEPGQDAAPANQQMAMLQPTVELDGALAERLTGREFKLNGESTRYLGNGTWGDVLDGDISEIVHRGINVIEDAGSKIRVWYEDRRLRAFSDPYPQSYAIIAAVDDYGEDTNRTGFGDLGFMVEGARNLVHELTKLGFSRDNIIDLYNEEATSENIDSTLRKFWHGGEYADADRLVFYFGGHGSHLQLESYDRGEKVTKGYLVTYDHKPSQPTATSLLLDDIIQRHFRYITANHFLVLLDSCSSGLALPRYQDQETTVEELERFQKLATLRAETLNPARNIIVAGTGEERALYENGGVFTHALVSALSGNGDWNSDGLIQFEELAMQVRNEVIERTRERGVDQKPESFASSGGRVVFVLD